MPKSRDLTPKQQAFVREYLRDLNASQAALRAGYSAKTAPFIGAETLKKPQVAAAIQTALEKRAERNQVTVDEVIALLRREADYRGEGASHGARVSAAGLLAKHVGMLVDRSEHHEQKEITVRFIRE